jgi:hypothetical protein
MRLGHKLGVALLLCTFGCVSAVSGQNTSDADGRTGTAQRAKLDLPTPKPLVREADLGSGGNLTLEVNVGDVRILPAEPGGKLRLELAVKSFDDTAAARAWIREFFVTPGHGKIVLKMPMHGAHSGTITLYVPPTTNLKAGLDVGDMRVTGIAGDKDLKVGIGDLDVSVADPRAYHSVNASVRIGDVSDIIFKLSPSGFLGKSASRQMADGQYRLRLHVIVGDISVKGESAQQARLH